MILDLSLFSVPTFAWGNLTAAMVAVGEFALLFVLPLYLVYALRLTIMETGWVLAAMAIGAFLAGAGARHLAARLGPPRVVTVGLLLELGATVAAAVVIGNAPSVWAITVLLAVYGLGLGLAAAQLTSVVLHDVPVAQSGTASATQSTVRQLGSAVGAAVAGTILAIGFTITVPARLALVKGVSTDDAMTMIDYMTGTAGAVISMIRDKGNDGYFGDLGPRSPTSLSVLRPVRRLGAVGGGGVHPGRPDRGARGRAGQPHDRPGRRRRQGTVKTGKGCVRPGVRAPPRILPPGHRQVRTSPLRG